MDNPAAAWTADSRPATGDAGWLSATAAAAVLGVSQRTVRRAIARGELPALKRGGVYQIAPADLRRYQPGRRDSAPPTLLPQRVPPPLIPVPDLLPAVAAFLRPRSALIGREHEIATVLDLVLRDDTGLVTLTGPGGVGKTRLALAAAAAVEAAFPAGVRSVSLAPIRDPALVVPAVAQALGVREGAAGRLLDRLAALLGDKRLLLVLDNFEHVVEAAPFVVDLLSSCPKLAVLVTSRARLRLSGEREVPVPPLSVPTSGASDTVEEVAEAAAVRLFIERAQGVRPDFALSGENAGTVTAICRRLDGLPLAIELAAARIAHIPLDSLLVRLEAGLGMLSGGPRDAPARLRTMRDAIAWSYDLLSSPEQALFRRLAVFVGGFTLEAAEAMGEATGDPSSDPFDGIAALLDASLLRREAGPGGEPRYLMLETVREYALERLAASGEGAGARDAHATFFLAFAERAAPVLLGGIPVAWLDRLAADHDNLRAAFEHFCRAETAEACVRLAAACGWYWYRRGHIREGRARLDRALALAGPEPTAAKGRALRWAGSLAVTAGDLPAAMALGREGLAVWDAVDDPRGRVFALNLLALIEVLQGHWDAAAALFGSRSPTGARSGSPAPSAWSSCGSARWRTAKATRRGRGRW